MGKAGQGLQASGFRVRAFGVRALGSCVRVWALGFGLLGLELSGSGLRWV